MKVTIIGSGYVGTTAAGLFALAGHQVTALDVNPEKVSVINDGKAPFFEQGLNEIIAHAVKKGSLHATTDYKVAIKDADFVFSCVGTPDRPDGSSDLQYVYQAAEAAAKYLKAGAIYIQKSTVPVGTGKNVTKLLPPDVPYVSNPEFLREGTAIYDSLVFDRVVAGGSDGQAVSKVLDLHKSVEARNREIARVAHVNLPKELVSDTNRYVSVHLESAELIKVTANAFLALKISFANSIAKLCDEAGADVVEIMDVVGSDKRIGRAFLNAGRGYGGGCFPKDVSGLISSAAEHGVDMPIMTAATEVNTSMPGYIASRAEEHLDGTLVGKRVAVLGLAFKAGTSDARKSPGVELANLLAKAGAKVSVYDPYANEEAKPDLKKTVSVRKSLTVAVQDTEAVFVSTDWPEFLSMDLLEVSKIMGGDLFVDAMNSFDIGAIKSAQLRYIGVGR